MISLSPWPARRDAARIGEDRTRFEEVVGDEGICAVGKGAGGEGGLVASVAGHRTVPSNTS